MLFEYYFDFSCPFAYLGSTRIERIAEEAGAELAWRPMLLGGVFRDIGVTERGPEMPPQKARHNALDMVRFAELWGVPLEKPAGHPHRTVAALRALLSLDEAKWPPVIHAIYRAYWQRAEDVSRPEVLARALEEGGIGGEEAQRALAAGGDEVIKADLRRRTDEAVSRGVFGAPTVFLSREGEESLMFFGQDRFEMALAVARGWRPDAPAPARERPESPTPARPDSEPATLDFFYDFSSPFSYLAATQVEGVAARTGARLRWRPFLLGAVFNSLGTANVPINAMPAAKRQWMAQDMQRWAAWFGVPFRFNSNFPLRTVTPLRLALLPTGRETEITRALYRAAWVEDRNVGDDAVLAEVLAELGLDAQELLAGTKDQEIKDALKANTTEAIESGAFGAPTFLVSRAGKEPQLFWGQDRLAFVERELAR